MIRGFPAKFKYNVNRYIFLKGVLYSIKNKVIKAP